MISQKDFKKMKKEMESTDELREKSIILSRNIIKLSKTIIYSVHRDDINDAKKQMAEMRKKVQELASFADIGEGHVRTAFQEYVEAATLYFFVSEKRLATSEELKVSAEHYLLGICDLSGEMVRLAINSSIRGDKKNAYDVREFLNRLYRELLDFDLRNGDIRRKFDGIKYDLQKLDDLVFELEGRK